MWALISQGLSRPLAADLLALPAQYTGLKSHFVSGVATNYQAGKDFNDALGGRAKLEFVVENDALAGRLFIDFLEWQCLRSPRIAVLAEDEAEYGKFFPPLSKGREVEKSHKRLALRYPRGIARLRDAYQREDTLPSVGDRSEDARGGGIKHTLKDVAEMEKGNERDTISAFSPLQSPASQQAALSGIASDLRRDQVAIRGIV